MTGLNNSRMAGSLVLPPDSGEGLVCRGAGASLNGGVHDRQVQAEVCRNSTSLAFAGVCGWDSSIAGAAGRRCHLPRLVTRNHGTVRQANRIHGKADAVGREMSSVKVQRQYELLVSVVCH